MAQIKGVGRRHIYSHLNDEVFHTIQNIAGRGEIAGYQHFLIFPLCFQIAFPTRLLTF